MLFLISKIERRDWICERNNLLLNLCAKALCSQKVEVSEGLKTNLRLKEVLVTAKVSLVSFKVNASLITLL
jgi:hypothetical protein